MTLEIDLFIVEGVSVPETAVSLIKTAVQATLQHEQVDNVALSILLTNDAEIQAMNRDYRGEDQPTDVLSFSADNEMTPPEMAGYLGDIAISVPTAGQQAQKSGHDLLAELQLLAVHGVLHLLAYDHLEPVAKEAMWAAQTAVLTQLNLSHINPTEDPHA